jgi:hypothetical protein
MRPMQEAYLDYCRRLPQELRSDLPARRHCDKVRKAAPMPKFVAVAASLKAVFIASSLALARGDMLSVILISALFNLVQLGAKPVGQTPPDTIVISPNDECSADRDHTQVNL